MKNIIAQQAIESFLNLFSAKLEIKSIVSEYVYTGVCSWEGEEDTQDVKWFNIYNDKSLQILHKICEYITINDLNKSDKIIISEKKLKDRLAKDKWNFLEIDLALEVLISFTVLMYDDGEYASSFIIHF